MADAATEATRLLAAALQVGPEDIGEGTAIGESERWDSLAHMRLVLGLEEFLGQELDTADMLGIEKYQDVVSFLEKHIPS